MTPIEFCQQFNLIEFVRENPEQIAPFAFSLDGLDVSFRDVGVIEFSPKHKSNTYLVLSVGIHGNETAPIELVSDLVSRILNKELKLAVHLLVLVGNPKAMLKAERFIGFNLNRLFNGEWKNHLDSTETEYEAKRARLLESEVTRFYNQSSAQGLGDKRVHYDLHTAIKPSLHQKFVIYPFLHERKHSEAQIKFLLDAGVDTFLFYHKPSTTFSYFSSFNFKAHGFTVELGKVKPFGDNNRDDFIQFEQALTKHLSGDYNFEATPDISRANLYQVKAELLKYSEMSELGFESESTPNFTQFNRDDLLLDAGKDSYLVEQDGEAIVFPNNKVPVGQRMGLVVVKKLTEI